MFADSGKKGFVSLAAVSRDWCNQPGTDPQILNIAISGDNYFGKF